MNARPSAQFEHKLSSSPTPHSWRLQVFSDLWRLANLRHLVVGGRVPDLALVQLSALTNLTSFRRLELEYDDDCENWDDSVKHLALSHSQVGEGVRVGKWHYVGPATVGGTITVKPQQWVVLDFKRAAPHVWWRSFAHQALCSRPHENSFSCKASRFIAAVVQYPVWRQTIYSLSRCGVCPVSELTSAASRVLSLLALLCCAGHACLAADPEPLPAE